MIEKIKTLVKGKCSLDEWDYHISLVVKYSKLLAKKLNANEEIAELGALLHDIGWITDIKNDSDHEISGQIIAEEILKDYDYPQDTINEIKHIIASHRGGSGAEPKTVSAKIVANADAMAHFDVVPWLIQIGLKNNNGDLRKAVEWTYKKIERDWNNKLTLPEAKELTQKKYEGIKSILEPMINK